MAELPIDVEDVLGAAGAGGQYSPATDGMVFAQRVPDPFPYLDFPSIRERDIGFLAAVLEEFAHRFQFQTTHVGVVYRLACLVQSLKVVEALARLGEDRNLRLPVPWLGAESSDETLRAMLEDLHALDDFKRLVFGLSMFPGRSLESAQACFPRVKTLIEGHTPCRLGFFGTFGNLASFYDASGRLSSTDTTRAVVESHASAYAFEFLRRHAPGGLEPAIEAYIKKNRRGLYRSVERIAESLDEPVTMDLGAVLRLGDYAMDGKLVDVHTIVPPVDYVESALPAYRYAGTLQRFGSVRQAADVMGADDLSLEEMVEVLIHVHGDDRGLIDMDTQDVVQAQDIQLRREIERIEAWIENEEQERPLTGAGLVTRREIARASITFMKGVLSYAPDARKFAPSMPGLVALCRICDLPSIEYPDGFEIFRCEPRDVDRQFLAFRMFVYSVASVTALLLRADPVQLGERSARLRSIHLMDAAYLAEASGASLSQLT